MVIFDVDGVLTDGRLIYDSSGGELKSFNAQDGLGVVLLRRAGIKTGIITGKQSQSLVRRAKEMGISTVYQNALDKLVVYHRLLKELKLRDQEICYLGDDLLDLPILRRVGLAVAVANAVEEVRKIAHYITANEGGRGAAREVVELILKTQAKWAEVTKEYRK